MTHEAAPDRSRGPRFRLEGCREGNVTVIRDDVPDDVAAALEGLADDEPPLCDPEADPVHAARYVQLLGEVGSHVEPSHAFGLNWVLPGRLSYRAQHPLVRSGTADGDELLARFAKAVHPSLLARGFRAADNLWPPWCAAVLEGVVVAIAETVRAGPGGVEVGVNTAVGFRGQGLGAAVTAGWSRHPDFDGIVRFYGTTRSNTSSRRVVDRLALPFLGCSFGVA